MNHTPLRHALIAALPSVSWPAVRRVLDFMLVVLAVVVAIYLDWDLVDVAQLAAATYLILHPLPSRVLARWTVAFMPLVPYVYFLGKQVRADEAARILFFLFAATVLTALAEAAFPRRLEGGE